jgi:hypothetical protein
MVKYGSRKYLDDKKERELKIRKKKVVRQFKLGVVDTLHTVQDTIRENSISETYRFHENKSIDQIDSLPGTE